MAAPKDHSTCPSIKKQANSIFFPDSVDNDKTAEKEIFDFSHKHFHYIEDKIAIYEQHIHVFPDRTEKIWQFAKKNDGKPI